MKSNYQEQERAKAIKLLSEENEVFYGAKGGKNFMHKVRAEVLKDNEKNLYQPIRENAINYFKQNGISWWRGSRPTGHTLSSQIACINHLFAIREDKEAVLSLLKSVSDDFVDVEKIEENLSGYIQFEAVSDNDHLNERQSTRGSNCTSIDALILAKHKDGSKWLIPIEWKYTEHYNDDDNDDKSTESRKDEPKGTEGKGKERLARYSDLINNSKYLKALPDYRSSVYFFEPFYQLMRQTLWAEQMIEHKGTERLKADNFLHLHIIPKENGDLLKKNYKCSGSDMESTWRECLKDNAKYKIITPEKLLENLDREKYKELIDYLTIRYFCE